MSAHTPQKQTLVNDRITIWDNQHTNFQAVQAVQQIKQETNTITKQTSLSKVDQTK